LIGLVGFISLLVENAACRSSPFSLAKDLLLWGGAAGLGGSLVREMVGPPTQIPPQLNRLHSVGFLAGSNGAAHVVLEQAQARRTLCEAKGRRQRRSHTGRQWRRPSVQQWSMFLSLFFHRLTPDRSMLPGGNQVNFVASSVTGLVVGVLASSL
jgi:hypothetical protein